MSKIVAKLVRVTLTTRVCVREDATDEQIMSVAKRGFLAKIHNDELIENIESIEEDTECPYGSINKDK